MTEDFDTRADELAVNIEAKIAESAAIIANTDFDPQYRRMAEPICQAPRSYSVMTGLPDETKER
jgi:hypothetical protein